LSASSFLLDLRTTRASAFSRPRLQRSIGYLAADHGFERSSPLARAFDAVIFEKQSHAADDVIPR
jgi:hypothetical protein